MKKVESAMWVWLLPEEREWAAGEEWARHGGKWIVFDTREHIEALAARLGPFIDSGEIAGGKFWNGDPSGLNVYSLDSDRDRVRKILADLDAGNSMAWEYDYAWDKNLRAPFSFLYSWCSKFRTILQSYGVGGAFRLMKAALQERGD